MSDLQPTRPNQSLTVSIEDAFKRANFLIEKNLVPASVKKPEVLFQIITAGASLGLDEIASVNSIDIIQGAICIKSKMIPGLLAKHNISVEVLKDYEPIYKEVPSLLKDKDGQFMTDEHGQFIYHRNPDTGKAIYKKEETGDYVTQVRLKRFFPNIGLVTNDVEFKWSQAIAAGWTTKDNWKKMPAYMMMARCITKAARIAASDVLAGLYDNYEVAEFTNVDVDMSDVSM